jgi:hypothetical protein
VAALRLTHVARDGCSESTGQTGQGGGMILIGTMEWASTVERGDFFCPACNASKSFQRKVARPFLTLYFIPVVPLGGLREFVLCRSCRRRFEPEILSAGIVGEVQTPHAAGQTHFDTELLRLIALMMVEDDHISEAEVTMATKVYQSMLGRPLPRHELERTCREVVALRIKASRYVTRAGEGMTYDQKLMAVQAMFAVAGAEGQISPRRLRSLMDAQQRLGIDEVAFQTAIKDASQWVA